MSSDASKNRKRFLLVIAIFAMPILISYLAYYVWQPQGAVRNYGELIPVQTLPDTAVLTQADGRPLPVQALRGKWLMLMVHAGPCAAPCEKDLYAMRQVRLMQGREQERVVRIWLSPAVPQAAATPKPLTDGVLSLQDTQAVLVPLFEASGPTQGHIYLVDPLGNLMMRWPQDPDLKRMHKDLERVLKYSQIG